jgi:hypothetical protein
MKRKLTTNLDRDMVISYLKRLDLKKLYTVDVIEKKATRTISQNSLYWLWLTCIEFETGNDRNELHDIFKKMWIEPKTVEKFGVKIERFTTTDLNTIQFKYFLDHVQIFASTELTITLPDPDDKQWEQFYSYYIDKL